MGDPGEGLRLAREKQREHAEKRFEDSEAERERNRRQREESGVAVRDTLEQLNARAARLLENNEATMDVVMSAAMKETPNRQAALERIIGETNDLQSWSFLPRGARAAQTVARLSTVAGGRELPLGTGFLVCNRLMLTNNHVLPDEAAAAAVVADFSAEVDVDNRPCTPVRFRLDPATFFVTSEHLDMSLVLLQSDADGKTPGEYFGYNQLIRSQGKIVTGENVNVVGHPMGRLKEISIRHNSLEFQIDDFLQYVADTEPGNSGSPVYNDQWEVVALHHAGVAKKDDSGRVLRKDGQLWRDGDGDDAIDWIANEGARVSVILTHLSELQLDDERVKILGELGSQAALAGDGNRPGPQAIAPSGTGTLITGGAEPDVGQRVEASSAEAGRSAGLVGKGHGDLQLVFLHGRSQQGKDPARLRNAWMAGLNTGLTLSDLSPLSPQAASFPFYGDRLSEVLSARESFDPRDRSSLETAEALAPQGGSARIVYDELIAQAASDAGMPGDLVDEESSDEGLGRLGSLAVGKLQRQLSWLAGRSGLDAATIALVFKDVAAYLGEPDVREAVLEVVAEVLPTSGPMVFVSHSLGTVVAMDVLKRLDAAVDVPLLVTAGSPLGMDSVYKRLLAGGPERPERIGRWVNAWCPADAVAIGCPLRKSWGSDVIEVVTDNPPERAHDIQEYLAAAAVARDVGRALGLA